MTVRRSLAIAVTTCVAFAGLVTATTTSAASGAAPAAKLQPRAVVDDTTVWAAVRTIDIHDTGAVDIAVNGADDTVYVINGLPSTAKSMVVINGTTGLLDDTVSLPANGLSVAVDQNDDTIYTVTQPPSGTLNRVQSRSAADPGTILTDDTIDSAYNLAVDSLDDTVYVSRTGGTGISYFSGRAPLSDDTKTVGGSTYGIAVDQMDDSVWMSLTVDDSVRAWNAKSNVLGGFISTGAGVNSQPDAVAVNSHDDTVYVADSYPSSKRLWIFDGRTNSRVSTIFLNAGSVTKTNGLAVDDSTDMLFATAPGDNRMFVINGVNTDDSVMLVTGAGAYGVSYSGFTAVAVDDSGPNQGLVWGADVDGIVQAMTQVTPTLQGSLTGAAGATVSFTVTPTSVALPFTMSDNTVWGVSFNDGTPVYNVSRVNSTTWSVPLPSGLPAGPVSVEVLFNGNQYALAGMYTVQSSGPPAPVYPPGAPTDVTAVAGVEEASVSWTAPSYSGSYPITDYQVTSAPGAKSCLVKAPALSCTVTGLTAGVEYRFQARALNGAGWGVYSEPSNAVTPSAPVRPSILITGSRDASDTGRIQVAGTSTGLVGERVTPFVRFPGGEVTAGTGVQTVAADGSFAWSRKTGKKAYVYFAYGSTRSNTVVIPAR